jgi:zinc transport system permease protein
MDKLFSQIGEPLHVDGFIVKGTIAIILVSLICGGVGSLVVGKQMAFFSDALAHCAFAGISLGIIGTLLVLGGKVNDDVFEIMVLPVMVAFGVICGVGIAFVREKTALANDTVIGVFFAGAVGFGAILFGVLKQLTNREAEMFLFGGPNLVTVSDLFRLLLLGIITLGLLFWRYNQLVFATFNPSLARSRGIPLRLFNYLFIVLLALVVNLCIKAIGILLINAMLIVPAATASNLSRNMRQLFWWTIALSLATGLTGQWLSSNVELNVGLSTPIPLGAAGCIVVLSVLAFIVSMFLNPWIRGRQTR